MTRRDATRRDTEVTLNPNSGVISNTRELHAMTANPNSNAIFLNPRAAQHDYKTQKQRRRQRARTAHLDCKSQCFNSSTATNAHQLRTSIANRNSTAVPNAHALPHCAPGLQISISGGTPRDPPRPSGNHARTAFAQLLPVPAVPLARARA